MAPRIVFGGHSKLAILVVALLSLGPPAILAVEQTGDIEVLIVDDAKVPLPGVALTLTGTNLQGARVAATNVEGRFTFRALPPGTYTIDCEIAGYSRIRQGEIVLAVGRTVKVGIALVPGELTDTVSVIARTPLVDAVRTTSQETYDRDFLDRAVPGVSGRDKLSVLATTPGTVGGGEPAVRGSSRIENAFLIDGIDMGDPDPVFFGVCNVSFCARRGEVVAIVGTSGSGKTTLVNLLPRFYDVTEGAILIDGVDVRQATLASLRAQIGLVTQETVLFNDTVRANIAYGMEDVDEARVETAARATFAHDFILDLPRRYDTVIGERGSRLSGGQRQRIAIARALLKDPPILILDEATSSLDSESERAVQQALERLMAGRTVVVIAHRLSTVRRADQLVVLSEGRVVERGCHAGLLAAGGLYRRLHDLQLFEPEPGAEEAAYREDTLNFPERVEQF